MKKVFTAALVITACAALCASLWPRSAGDENVPAEQSIIVTSPAQTEISAEPVLIVAPAELTEAAVTTEKEEAPPSEAAPQSEPPSEPAEEPEVITAESATPSPTAQIQAPPPTSADPYHTDVYPNNVYSEELIYDVDGNLIGKTVTIPTEFGPDAIWIGGRAYYDVPGFGLVEWSGPGQHTEDYAMYESGVKVGIMGGEDDTPARASTPVKPQDWPEPTGEVIDQTISTAPERSSAPPDYKPNTTPPTDLGINNVD